MPFITLNNNWSSLAQYYNNTNNNGSFSGTANAPNVTNTQKPTIPSTEYSKFDDGLIRGGAINAALSTARDIKRIGQFYITGAGVSFLIKQVGLQRTNPKLEETSNTTFDPTRTYNLGINTLASVGGTAFGLHFDRSGLFPIIPDTQKYGGNINAPTAGIAWQNNFGPSAKVSVDNIINKDSTNRLLNYLSIISKTPTGVVTLNSYSGGSSSFYGIGRTRINTTNIRTGNVFTSAYTSYLNGFTPLTTTEIIEAKQASLTSDLESQLSNSPLSSNKNIAGYNIEKRIGVSSPAQNKLDSINSINIIDSKTFYDYSEGPKSDVSNKINASSGKKVFNSDNVNGSFGNDLIKFRIEFLNNNSPIVNQLINTDVLAFRAYLDSFDDGMTAKWDSYRYMGRGEEFYIYNGFTRDIGVSFTMHAHSEQEMAPLYSKLNYLMSAFSPDYSPSLKMRGNIGYLTVGDYLYRQPGVFTDIKLSGMLDGSWEIGLDENGNSNGQYEVPRMIKVQLGFKPIHSFLPRRNYSSKEASGDTQKYPAPFITPDRIAYPIKVNSKDNTNNKYLNTGGWAPPTPPSS